VVFGIGLGNTKTFIFALMCYCKALILSLLCLLSAGNLLAQGFNKTFHTKSSYTRGRYNNRAPRVGHQKAKIICPIFVNSKYPYQGLGLKLGDPFAFTYKFYPRKHIAFVADVGKPSSGLYSKYFREEFSRSAEELIPNRPGIEYSSHKVKADFLVEARALYQLDLTVLSKGLQVYTGIGWEYRITKLDYDYFFETGPNENEFARFSRQRSTQGVQGTLGIEYAYFQIPISAFMEIEYCMDIVADPGQSFLQGGIGLRYVF
jgi:hypothetical protein